MQDLALGGLESVDERGDAAHAVLATELDEFAVDELGDGERRASCGESAIACLQ